MGTLLGIVVFVLVGIPLIGLALTIAFTVLAAQVYLIGAFVLYLVGIPLSIVVAVMDRRALWPAPDERQQAKARKAWADLRASLQHCADLGMSSGTEGLRLMEQGRHPDGQRMPDWMTGGTD